MLKVPGLENKIVLVTGGGKGIGNTIVRGFIESGAIVTILDIDFSEEKRQELIGRSPQSNYVYGNIKDSESLIKIKQDLQNKYGTLDILVNNAGIVRVGEFSDISEDEIKEIIETNTYGTILSTKIFGDIMVKNKRGKVVNLVSTDAHVGTTGHTSELGVEGVVAYAASKGAVLSFTKVLAVEWGKYNINVNGISPILVQTPMTQHLFEDIGRLREYNKGLPLERNPVMQDIAYATLYLASPLADSITGHIINVDCGYLAKSMRE